MQSIQHTQPTTASPLVSFIIAYYNLPVQMLIGCIESILELSLTAMEREIIVIDDGSDVSPVKELIAYEGDVVYVRQKHGGLSRARNKGIGMATGRYIQFVDADDALQQAAYEHCLDQIRFNAQLDMVMFDFTNVPDLKADYTDEPMESGSDYLRHHNIHGSACGYLFRRDILGELRFTPDIWHEDEEFTPQLLLRADNVVRTDAKAYIYRQRPQSIMQTRNDITSQQQHLNDLHGVIARLHRLCDSLTHNDRLAMQRRVAQLTMDYIYKTVVLTRSQKELSSRLEQLRGEGLFPLPDHNYSQKYSWFRRMTNSRWGQKVLLHALPLFRAER